MYYNNKFLGALLVALFTLLVQSCKKVPSSESATTEEQQDDAPCMVPFAVTDTVSSIALVDSVMKMVRTGDYSYVMLETGALATMYCNLYVMGEPLAADFLNKELFISRMRIKPNRDFHQAEISNHFNARLMHALREFNQTATQPISVLGLSYVTSPFISFESKIWNVSKYNQAGMTDSLMTYCWDEECVMPALAKRTVALLDEEADSIESLIGHQDRVIWKRFFERHYAHNSKLFDAPEDTLDSLMCEDFYFLDQEFPGRKLVIGCKELIRRIEKSAR